MALGKNVIGRAVLELSTEDRDLTSGLDEAEAKTSHWSDSVGIKAIGAVTAIASVTAAVLGSSVRAAADAQRITAQTDAVLASTKGMAGVTKEAVLELAASLAAVIPIEEGLIQETQNVLLTFTNISSEIFPQATETALDMATALGTDAGGAAIALGKALNDPILGVAQLTRMGVTFTDAQKTAIKTMVESGDVMGAQQVILDKLSEKFGGSARAAGTTFAGQLEIAKGKLTNVQEEIGMALIPALTGLLQAVTPAIQAFGEWLPGALDQAQKFMTENEGVITTLGAVLGWLAGTILPGVVNAFQIIIGPIQAAIGVIQRVWQIAKDAAGAIGNLIGAIGRLPGVQGVISTFQKISGIAGGGGSGPSTGGPFFDNATLDTRFIEDARTGHAKGGLAEYTGLHYLHAGETVVPEGGSGADRPIVITLDGQVLARVVGNRQQERSFLAGGALG